MIDESGLVVYHSSLDRRAGKDDTVDCSAEAIGNRKRLQCAPPSRERWRKWGSPSLSFRISHTRFQFCSQTSITSISILDVCSRVVIHSPTMWLNFDCVYVKSSRSSINSLTNIMRVLYLILIFALGIIRAAVIAPEWADVRFNPCAKV